MGPDVSANIQDTDCCRYRRACRNGRIPSLLPLGIWAADAIVAVSPRLRGILTAQFGCGLEDYLHARRDLLNGILNGID